MAEPKKPTTACGLFQKEPCMIRVRPVPTNFGPAERTTRRRLKLRKPAFGLRLPAIGLPGPGSCETGERRVVETRPPASYAHTKMSAGLGNPPCGDHRAGREAPPKRALHSKVLHEEELDACHSNRVR